MWFFKFVGYLGAFVLMAVGVAGIIVADYTPNPYCLLYTSPSPRDLSTSRMPSSA